MFINFGKFCVILLLMKIFNVEDICPVRSYKKTCLGDTVLIVVYFGHMTSSVNIGIWK